MNLIKLIVLMVKKMNMMLKEFVLPTTLNFKEEEVIVVLFMDAPNIFRLKNANILRMLKLRINKYS